MTDMEFDPTLARVSDRLASLGRDVEYDPARKLRLRAQLLQRHEQLYSGRRPTSRWWLDLSSVKRLPALAPIAAAAAVVLSTAVWGLQAAGSHPTRTAEAQRLTVAMVRTAPTVTGWTWTVTHHLANATRFSGFTTPLAGRVYLYRYGDKLIPYWRVDGQWKGVPVERQGTTTGTDWQWAFAQLPVRLANHQATVLRGTRRIGGQDAVGVQYELSGGAGVQVRAIAWIDALHGRILLLERQIVRGAHLVEEDSARYLYQRGSH